MQAPRLNEVLTRVVAWHNRHPLARRINPTQVHSIGEVLLPFASSEAALSTGPAAPGLPTVDDLPDPPQAAALAGFSAEIDAPDHTAETEAPAEQRAAVHQAAADSDALGPDLAEASPFTLAEADQAALAAETAAAAETAEEAEAARTSSAQPGPHDPDPHADLSLPLDPPDPSDLQRRSTDQPAAHAAGHPTPRAEPDAATGPAQAGTSPFAAALAARSASAPASKPSAPAGPLRRWLARLPGRRSALPRLQALFSRDFIWPLSPRRVARWARRHGQLQPIAPADWPRREVEADSSLQAAARQKGLGQTVALHVLTAAVGVGDRRLRLLMAADGQIIGPRAYSPPRLGAAGTLLALALLGAGWAGLRPATDEAATLLAARGAAADAASAAPSAASAAPSAASAAVASTSASTAATPAAVTEAAASALRVAESAVHTAAAADPGPDPTLAVAPATRIPVIPAAPVAPVATAAAPSDATAPAATAAASAAGNAAGNAAAIGRIRPLLSDEDKQAARAQTAALRSGKPAADSPGAQKLPAAPKPAQATAAASPSASTSASPATVYALVTAPNPQRASANTGLAVMRRASGRLTPPVPEHTELMQDQGRWRAAWWPFVSLADAERARVLLAGKGIKAEVVEF